MTYALWVIGTANIVQAYESERAALALVLRNLDPDSDGDTTILALTVEDEDGNVTFIAQGQELAEMARGEFSAKRATG